MVGGSKKGRKVKLSDVAEVFEGSGKNVPEDMEGAALYGSAMTGAAVTGAAMTGAAMTGAAMTGAALTGAGKKLNNLYGSAKNQAELAGIYAGGCMCMEHGPEVAKLMLKNMGVMRGSALTGAALTGAGWWQDFKRGFMKGLRAVGSFVTRKVAPVVSKVASVAAPVLAAVPGMEEFAPVAEGVAKGAKAVSAAGKMAGLGKGKRRVTRQRKSKATGARAKRNALVKKLMKEKGMKLPEASRYIKENGLM